MIWNALSWLVFGLVVGVIARFLLPGRQQMGLLVTAVVGIVGSFVGGGLSWLIFGGREGAVSPAGLVMSTIGAIVVLLIYGKLQGKSEA
jgi:uncharacterized membrane protein YeaQ/YmgE (transglycosylase-associated protein family)